MAQSRTRLKQLSNSSSSRHFARCSPYNKWFLILTNVLCDRSWQHLKNEEVWSSQSDLSKVLEYVGNKMRLWIQSLSGLYYWAEGDSVLKKNISHVEKGDLCSYVPVMEETVKRHKNTQLKSGLPIHSSTTEVPHFLNFTFCSSCLFYKIQFSSVAHSCLTLCDPMNCSTPGLPGHHQLLEFTQTHIHRVGDAIQPSHPLSSPSPPAPKPSQHQSLFQWVNSSHEVAKVLEFQL